MKIRHLLITSFVASVFTVTTTFAMQNNAHTSSDNTTVSSAPSTTQQTTPKDQTSFNPQQVIDIQNIVRNYLINNPQVLVEASQALQKQTEQKQAQFAQQAIRKNVQQIFNDSASPVAGNPNGNVTLVEFFDYQCGHCKAMNKTIQTIVDQNKNLRIIFKELPIFGGNSQYAAKASLAAAKQHKYYVFHDALLSVENPLTKEKVLQTARRVGLNVTKLRHDMNSPIIARQLHNNFKLAQSSRLLGTPTFIIANKSLTTFKFIPGATSKQNLQQLISEIAQKKLHDVSATTATSTTNSND